MALRESLVETVAFALTRCRQHFRVMIQSHNTDEARRAAAEIIIDQIKLSGFDVSQRPSQPPHSTLGGPSRPD